MAPKTRTHLIKLLSTAGTGYFYVFRRVRNAERKLQLMKYDPRVNRHVLFVETKLKSST